jgi:hypothetical protein
MQKATLGNKEDLDLDFIGEPTLLLRNSGFRKAKNIASTNSIAVLQQLLHQAIIEHQLSLSVSVSPTAAPSHHLPTISCLAHSQILSVVSVVGCWKCALNPGSCQVGNPVSTGVLVFDLELSPKEDLLHICSGIEQFLTKG